MQNNFNYILLIDDNEALSFLNKNTIEKQEVTDCVLTAKNGRDALETIIENGIPQLIFLDINMPIMNGWEFLATYKKIEPTMDKSTIVLTTGISLDSQEEKLANTIYKITNFCDKIINKETLLGLVDDMVCKPKQNKYIYN